MKNILIFSAIFFSNILVAQDTTIIYLNSMWEVTTKDKAVYERALVQKKENYYYIEDYLIGGLPYLKGQFHSSEIKQPFGEFVGYDEFGTITEVYHFNDSSELEGSYRTFDSEGRKDTDRNYLNGKKDGLWKWYYSNGLVAWFEQWRNDTLVMMQQFSPEGAEYVSKYNLNIAPKWADSEQDINGFLKARLPEKYLKNEINAVIFVYITSEGKLLKVDNKTVPNEELVAEIRKALMKDSKWLPALNRLRPIDGILECEIYIPKSETRKK